MMGLKASWYFTGVRKVIATTGNGKSFFPSKLKHQVPPQNWVIGFKITSPAFCTIISDQEIGAFKVSISKS